MSNGYDLDLVDIIVNNTKLPIIIAGGVELGRIFYWVHKKI